MALRPRDRAAAARLVLAMNVLHHVPDLPAATRELARVTMGPPGFAKDDAVSRPALSIGDSVAAGSSVLRIDLVNELVAWFSDLPGNRPHEYAITVR